MANTYSPNLGLTLPARGDYLNTWDSPLNANFSAIDSRFGGSFGVDVSNGSVALTRDQLKVASIYVQGSMGADASVVFPANVGGFFSILNLTSGVGNLSATCAGSSVMCQRGSRTLIFADGNTVGLADGGALTPPGTMLLFAGPNLPSGYLLCYGQAVSRATYAALFSAIGGTWGGGDGSSTFNVPDMRGRVGAGMDNMGGVAARRLQSLGGLSGSGGVEGFALSIGNMPAHIHVVDDPGHSHDINDPQHAHPYVQSGINNTAGGEGSGTANTGGNNNSNTGQSATGVTVKSGKTGISLEATGNGEAFFLLQPTAVVNFIIKY